MGEEPFGERSERFDELVEFIGVERLAVHLAARIESVAPAGGITVSRTVKQLAAGSDLGFSDRGEHQLKGIPDRWQLFDCHPAT